MSPQTPPRISLARLPTPLEPLDRLRQETGGPRIWLKRDDLTDTTACGNKLRKLEFVAGQALADGANVLITCGGVQSNHCRATATIAARLGLKCHLILRGHPGNDGNLLLDHVFGATITYLSPQEYRDLEGWFERIADSYRAAGDVPFSIPVGASDEIGLWGYIEACAELKADISHHQIEPAAVVCATGSGGTLGGLIIGNHRYQLDTQVCAINVSNDESYFVRQISSDFERWQARYGETLPDLPITVIDGYVGPGYGKADDFVYDTIRQVARLEGIVFDPVYTGKAFNALLSEVESGRFAADDDLIFVHTGGIFGLFTHRDQLAPASP